MASIDTSNYYNNLAELNAPTPSVRKVTSTSNGDSVVSEGDTDAFSVSETMGKDDFLNLLVTQLRYQNPLEPAADTEFVAQLAQFSQLENSQNMTDAIDTLTENMNTFMAMQTLNSQSSTNATATTLIGKEVRVAQSNLVYNGQGVSIDAYLSEGNKTGKMVLRDAKDNVVAEIAVSRENSKGGEVTVEWNGVGTDGTKVPAGSYSMEMVGADGESSAGYAYVEGLVTAVNFNGNGSSFTINGTQYGLTSLVKVQNAEI